MNKFTQIIAMLCQPFADNVATLQSMPGLFDLDVAVGQQLDFIGQWVGISRYVSTPITGVFFSFDTTGLGFDQGVWMGPYDATTGLTALPDDQYRTLIRAKIANNHWDGTIPGAYQVLAPVFPGHTVLIQDHGDMTMDIILIGAPLDTITNALFTGGYLNVKPAGVYINGFGVSSGPVFGFDADNSSIGGFDHGSWAQLTGGF